MKLLFDFFPILLFFIAYKLFNIYVATGVAIVSSFIQTGGFWLRHKHFETTHLLSFAIILLLGSATLISHDVMFIKWKPTAIYWVLATLFFTTQFIGNQPLIKRLINNKISLPDTAWKRLNACWALFFVIMGSLNLYIVYNFSTNTWVDFKLFGTIGLTVIFVLLQSLYMAKFLKNN